MVHRQLARKHTELSSYPRWYRTVEIASMVALLFLLLTQFQRLWLRAGEYPWLVTAAALLAYILADFFSGIVHWAADTWGSADIPLIGKTLVRPFREHHFDQRAIVRHDFIETNGTSCLVCVPVAVSIQFLQLETALSIFIASISTFFVCWVVATNEFHQWAHSSRPSLPTVWLQRMHLILPPAHHAIHHRAPFTRYYCITTGWLNRPLTAMGFFPMLEKGVTAVTGLVPRADELGQAPPGTQVKRARQLVPPSQSDDPEIVAQLR